MRKSSSAKTARKPTKRVYARKPALKGRGFYKGFGRDLGRAIGYGAGTVASSMTRMPGLGPAFATIGGHAGALGARATGWGEYKIQRNSLIASLPQIRNPRKEGSTQVRHKEYIGDVLSSTAFQTQYVININAALQASFPWLANIARNYQQYEVNGMLFEYRPTSGNAISSTNSSLGEVIMATNYDSVNEPFNNKLQMLNTEFSQSVVPSQGSLHAIECSPKQTSVNILYTRERSVPSGADPRLYDLGFFQLATSGQQTTTEPFVVGELWVTYDVLLYKPILVDDNQSYAHWQLGNVTTGAILGATQHQVSNLLDQKVGIDENNLYLFNHTSQPIVYLINYNFTDGAVSAVSGYPTITFTNCSQYEIMHNNTLWNYSLSTAFGVLQTFAILVLPNPSQNLDTGAAINFSGMTMSGSCAGDLFITQCAQVNP